MSQDIFDEIDEQGAEKVRARIEQINRLAREFRSVVLKDAQGKTQGMQEYEAAAFMGSVIGGMLTHIAKSYGHEYAVCIVEAAQVALQMIDKKHGAANNNPGKPN